MYRLKMFFLFFLSRSPIFTISIDTNFHEIGWNEEGINNVRFSLISFGMGTYKIYFFTICEKQYNWIKCLKLSDIRKLPMEEEINKKVSNYRDRLVGKSDSVISSELDFIKYKIGQCENAKNNASNKINFYNAVIMVFIGLVFSEWTNLFPVLKKSIVLEISGIAFVYVVINITVIIFSFMGVKGYVRASFKSIKESADKDHNIALSSAYYKEWQAIRQEAPYFVTYVTNLERYMKCFVLILCFFILYGAYIYF